MERATATVTEYYDPDAAPSSDPGEVLDAGASTQRSDDLESRSPAYLAERNRLLTERIDELEATLEGKDERIEALEAKIRRLEAE